MKISALNDINNIKTGKKVTKNNRQNSTTTNVNINSVAKNSLSEAIGRSQVVAFKGINKSTSTDYLHKCSDKDKTEEINYNKLNGIFTHTVKDYDGNLIYSETFDPQSHTQDIRSFDDKGNFRRTYTTPTEELTYCKDTKGRDTYYRKNNYTTQYCHEEITEYGKGRIIINDSSLMNGNLTTYVLDLKTKLPVTSGPLVIATRKDAKNNARITYNLITKQVLKKEQYDENGSYIGYREYSPDTGYQIRKGSLLASGNWEEAEYRNTSENTLSTRTIFAKNKKWQRLYEYAKDGKTEINKTELRFKNASEDSPVEAEIYYLLNTPGNIINTMKEYDLKDSSGNSFTYYEYNTNPDNNVPLKAQMINNGRIIEDIKYAPNGKFFDSTIEYLKNGNKVETKYTGKNRKVSERQFSPNDFLFKEIFYTNKLFFDRITKKYEYIKQTDEKIETLYYDSGREKSEIKTTKDGKVVYEKGYRTDGTIEFQRNFSADGSYEEKLYDEFGSLWQTRHYNKYGERDDYYYRNGNTGNSQNTYNSSNGYNSNRQNYNKSNSSFEYETNRTQRTKAKEKVETDEEILERISHYCASSNFSSISDKDWINLGRILNVEPDVIKNLEHDDYKKLALKFHPDVNSSPISSQILCILNALESRNKK